MTQQLQNEGPYERQDTQSERPGLDSVAMPKDSMEIDGQEFSLIKVRRNGLRLYSNPARDVYLNAGEPPAVEAELARIGALQEKGFPLPAVLQADIGRCPAFFVQASAGLSHYGATFSEELSRSGILSQEAFGGFISISNRFLRAQLNYASGAVNWNSFEQHLCIKEVAGATADLAALLPPALARIKNRIDPLPSTLCHGDFSPFNIFPAGVIDFEDTFTGPIGYDVLMNISFFSWFPPGDDFEYRRVYSFEPIAIKSYLQSIEETSRLAIGARLSDYIFEMHLLSGCWAAAGMEATPRTQGWRFAKLASRLAAYLGGGSFWQGLYD